MAKEVYVDQDECTGCEYCATELPEVFEMDQNCLSMVKAQEGAGEEDIQEIIYNCPAECIHWK